MSITVNIDGDHDGSAVVGIQGDDQYIELWSTDATTEIRFGTQRIAVNREMLAALVTQFTAILSP